MKKWNKYNELSMRQKSLNRQSLPLDDNIRSNAQSLLHFSSAQAKVAFTLMKQLNLWGNPNNKLKNQADNRSAV